MTRTRSSKYVKNVRLTKEEQELIREKWIITNRVLVESGNDAITQSAFIHLLIRQALEGELDLQ